MTLTSYMEVNVDGNGRGHGSVDVVRLATGATLDPSPSMPQLKLAPRDTGRLGSAESARVA